MSESDRIEQHIEETRASMTRSLEELESRLRESLDWRGHYEKHPWAFAGAALAGGVLLAGMFNGGGANKSNGRRGEEHSHIWDNIQAALLTVATNRALNLLSEKMPEFRAAYSPRE